MTYGRNSGIAVFRYDTGKTMTKFFLSALAIAVSATFAQADSHGRDVAVGDLTLSGAFTRATLPNAPVAGGFVTITNAGTQDDQLISAASEISNLTQIHEMKMENDVMKMRELPDGLIVPAGETVTLMPGGYHIMFMDLNGPLVEGETIAARLTFEVAGDVDINLPVGAPNAKTGDTMMHNMPAVSE
ncbi:MAG: copper(I)-binding protein [Yoonia sp.]